MQENKWPDIFLDIVLESSLLNNENIVYMNYIILTCMITVSTASLFLLWLT